MSEHNQYGMWQEGKLSLREVLLMTLLKFPSEFLDEGGCYRFTVKYSPFNWRPSEDENKPYTAWKISKELNV